MKRSLALAATGVTVAATVGVFAVTGPFAQASPHASHATPKPAAAKKVNEHFIVLNINDKNEYAVLHGVLNGYGKDTSPKDAYDVAYLNGGTVRITHPDKDETFTPHVNSKTCFATFTLTGKVFVGHGTGKYKGVTGTGAFTGHGQSFLARAKSGACSERSQPPGEVTVISGSMSLNK